MPNSLDREPHGKHQSKKAAASGWIGSALEYYDFFIYATARRCCSRSSSSRPTTQPSGSSHHWRPSVSAMSPGQSAPSSSGTGATPTAVRTVLILCMFLMGFSTMAVGRPADLSAGRDLAPVLLVILRLIQGFAVAGEISGASSMILEHAPFGRRGYFASFTLQGVQAGQLLAAAVFLPLAHSCPRTSSTPGAGGFRSYSASSSSSRVTSSAAKSTRPRPSPRRLAHGEVPASPIVEAPPDELGRYPARALHGAYRP